MPRPRRFEHEGALAHVINRGNRKELIFRDEEDYKSFESFLMDKIEACNIHLHAWCLMPNHFHLLVETPGANLSVFMRRLLTSYARLFNMKHHLVGHVFQGRYKAVVCDQDAYFLQLIRYIHLNPMRVKDRSLVKTLEEWPWSSHRHYLSGKGPHGVQELIDRTLMRFDACRSKAVVSYQRFLEEGLRVGLGGDFDQFTRSSFAGSEEFIEKVKEKCRVPHRSQTRSHKVRSVDELAAETARLLKIPLAEFRAHNKQRDMSAIRQAFAFVGRKHARLPATVLARYLGRDVSAISQMVSRVENNKITRSEAGQQLLNHFLGRKLD